MTTIITIRPEEGARATVAATRAMGLTVQAHPLSEIRPEAWQAPPPATIDALLLGSANAVRHGGEQLALYRGKPAFAVGAATAKAAEQAGFQVALIGQGGLQRLLAEMPKQTMTLLRLAAGRHVEVTLPAGIAVETRVAYRAHPLPMEGELTATLRAGKALVLLHSAAAAEHFAAECDRLAVPRHAITLAALGPRIAEAAGTGWTGVHSAPEPRESALLALVRDLCH